MLFDKTGKWFIDGRYWVRISDGRRLPIIQGGTSANTVQNARFAFGDDDGSESGHSLDTENAARTSQAADVTFLIRIQVEETNTKTDAWTFQLYADKNSSGTYTAMTRARTDGLRLADDTQSRADEEATTERLTAGAGVWQIGEYDDGGVSDGMSGNITLSGEYVDLEFAIEIDSANAVTGDYWDLRIESNTGGDLDNYLGTMPRVTAATILNPIEITPAAVASGADSITPTVRLSSVSVTPAVSSASADSIDPSVTPSVTGVILEIDFEENDKSDFDTETGGGNLSVSTNAGMVGTYGMEVDCTTAAGADAHGNNAGLSLTDRDFVRFRFYIDVTNLSMGTGDNFQAVQLIATYTALLKMGYLYLFESGGNIYPVLAAVDDDNSSRTTTTTPTPLTGEHWIECLIIRESTDGAVDGSQYLWIDGELQSGTDTDIDNYNNFLSMTSSEFGANSLDVGTTGTLYLDHLTVRDDDQWIGATPVGEVAVNTFEDGVLGEFDTTSDVDGDMSATANAAMVGSYGLELALNDADDAWGRTLHAEIETGVLRARLYIDTSALNLTTGDIVWFWSIMQTGGTPGTFMACRLSYSGTSYQLFMQVVDDADSWKNVFNAVDISDGEHYIEFYAKRETYLGAADGVAIGYIDGAEQAEGSGSPRAYSNSAGFDYIDETELGLNGVTWTSSSGVLYLDDFIISDVDVEIGEAPSADVDVYPAAVAAGADSVDPGVGVGEIIRLDFEEGDKSDFDSEVNDGGTLAVNETAALAGIYGLAVTLPSSGEVHGVNPLSISTTELRARFYIDINTLSMADTDNCYPLVIGSDGSYGSQAYTGWVQITQISGVKYINAGARDDTPESHSTTNAVMPTGKTLVEIYMKRESVDGANDGEIHIWVDGVENGSGNLTVDNYNLFPTTDETWFGVSYAESGSSGTIYLDDLIVRDDSKYIGGEIFNINFEDNDLLEFDSTTDPDNDLSTSVQSGMDGSYGMEVILDDTGVAVYGTVDISGELDSGVLRCRIYVDPNDCDFADGDILGFIRFQSTVGNQIFYLQLKWLSAGDQWQIKAWAYRDNSNSVDIFAYTNITDEPHYIEVLIRRATTDVAADGSALGWIDGTLQTQGSGADAFDNYDVWGNTYDIDVGSPWGANSDSMRGTIFLDGLVVRNDDTEIGSGPVDISPTAVSAGADSVDPSVQQGSINISPTAVSAGADSVGPGVSVGELFRLDFEENDLTDFDSLVNPDSDLLTSTNAAMVGVYGLEGIFDDATLVYGIKDISLSSYVYRLRVYIDISALTLADGEYIWFTSIKTSGVTSVSHMSIRVRRSGATYHIQAQCPDDDGNWKTFINDETITGEHYIEVAMYRATTASASDGTAVGYIDGVEQTPSAGFPYDNFDGFNNIYEVWLGILTNTFSASSGSLYLDDLIFRDDDTEIGAAAEDVDVTPAAVAAGADSVDPSVEQDSLNVSPSAVAAGADSVGPSVQQDSLNVSPTAVSAVADSVVGFATVGEIFHSDFEEGDTSEWGTVEDPDNHITVTTQAAMEGIYGAEFEITNQEGAWLWKPVDDYPLTELSARLYFDTNSLTMADNDSWRMWLVRGSGNPEWIYIDSFLRYYIDTYNLLLVVRNDDGSTGLSQSFDMADGRHFIEFHVIKATSDVASDGYAEWWFDGVAQNTASDIDNWDGFADFADFILQVGALEVGTIGTVFYDDVVIRDDGQYIGSVDENITPSAAVAGADSVDPSVQQAFNIQDTIAATVDDGSAEHGVGRDWLDNANTQGYVGDYGTDKIGIWARFNVTIPSGAIIQANTYLRYWVNSKSGSTPLTKIAAEDTAAPANPTTENEYDTDINNATTEKVDWDADLATGQHNNSPSLQAIIQELVDSYDYSSGAYILVLWYDDGSGQDDYWAVSDYDSAVSKPPELYIEYKLSEDTNVTPSAVVAGADSVDPEVEQDSLNVSPLAVAAGADSVGPSVQQDSLNVSPSSVAAGADSVDPTVELGDIGVTPTVGAASADSVDPTVRQDSLNVATTPVSSGADSINPSVEQGSQNVSPSAAAAGADSVDPSIEQDSLGISPTLVDAGADSVDPSVEQDSLNISPTVSSAGADSIDPTVDISGGGTNVWPTEATAGADSVDPTVKQDSMNVSPSASVAGADSVDPTTQQGDISLSPTETAAGADSVDPGVQVGSINITPAVTESGADSVNPTVQVGDLSLSPTLSDASAVGIDPTVDISGGDVNVSPAASVAGADSLVGEVRQGSISISPTLVDASAVSIDPTFQYSSVNVTPSVAAAGADSIDPTVEISLPPINITPSAASAATVAVAPSVTLSSVSVTPSAATAATATTIADVQEGEGIAPDPAGAGTDASVVIVGGNNRLIISFARVLIPVGDNLQVFPDPAAAGADSVSPSLYFTSDSASPVAVSAGTDAVDPTVGFTDVDVTPSAAAASADTVGPTVSHSSISSSPAPAAAGADSVDPTFQYGSISTQALTDALVGTDTVGPIVTGGFTFTPAPVSAGTDTVDPSVVHGDFSRTPEPVSAGTDVVAPSLHWSSHSSTLAPASAGTSASIGEVAEGGATVTPTPASAATDVVDPDVLQIGMLVSTDPASAGTDAHLGSVVQGGGFLDIYPVENYTQAASRIGEVRIDPAAPEFPDPAVAEAHTQGPTVQYTGGGVDIHPSSAYAQAAVSYKWFQVRIGSVGVTPAPASAGADTVLGEVRQHTLWLAPWVKYAVASTTDPTIRFGSVSLWKPPAIAKTDTTIGSAQYGSLDLAPAAATAPTSVVDPTILVQGGYTAVSPALVAVRAVSISPTIQLGSISITPTPAAAGAAVAVGVVLQFSTVDVYPVALSAGTRVVGPRVSQLAVALYPAAVTASTDAPLPTVFLGPEEVTSYPVFTRVNVTGPTVGLSGHSVTPGAAVAAASSVAPSITYGSINVSPAVASAIVVSVGPEYLVLDNLYPELDVVIGTWTDKAEGTTDLFDSLDERPEPDDSDYIMNETPDGEVYRADMDEGVDPGRDDHHYVEYRISKDSPLSQIDLTVTLKEGVTVIATWTHIDIAIEPVTIKQTLTTLQASNIGNYSDLYLEFDAVEV